MGGAGGRKEGGWRGLLEPGVVHPSALPFVRMLQFPVT